MFESFKFDEKKSAVIVSLQLSHSSDQDNQASVSEFSFLAKTLGIKVLTTFIQKRPRIEPNYYIGKGKMEEIKYYVSQHQVDTILFDNELTGIQARNLEKYYTLPIFGRTEIILNIFNKHARTNEAKLQVQLASLEYMLPRLRNRWDHFSRVEGGIGLRGGEGEKQIELDRRMIKNHINRIKAKLKKLDVQMKNRRKRRQDSNLVSLVGYTNAGKTSLMNILAKKDLFAENMLFSTLDSNIKKIYIDRELTILLNDTVGFINKLPHSLVVSFKSTLDEIKNSKLILHVIDGSSPSIDVEINSVLQVLEEINALHIPVIRVFNKIDLLTNYQVDIKTKTTDQDIFVSALKKTGINQLKSQVKAFFNSNRP